MTVLATPGFAQPAASRDARISEYSGEWEFATDDGTYQEKLELTISGNQVRGTLGAYRTGYYTKRTTLDGELRVDGVVQGDRLELRLIDPASGKGLDAQAWRRGAYLLMRGAGHSGAYARPGTPLVREASESPQASALARAVAGNVYQAATQASGRSGGFAGSRVKLALCANGEIAYDESDLATTSGPGFGEVADLGRTVSRRGEWRVVLYAGEPAIMAHWQGTGSSYSLTAYFDVRPAVDGRSIELSGKRLPIVGRC